ATRSRTSAAGSCGPIPACCPTTPSTAPPRASAPGSPAPDTPPTTGPPPPADAPARTAVYPLAVDASARARNLLRRAGEVRDGVRVRPARFPPGGHRRFWREGRERCLAACGAYWTGMWWPSSRVPVQRLDL